MLKEKNILIVGLGLIGGSYAEGLSSKGHRVYAWDIDENALESAKEKQWILNKDEDEIELVSKADLIIFGLYPSLIKNKLTEYLPYLKKDVILTDIAGIKTSFIYEIKELLKDEYKYISHHPMAGREKQGISYADKNIFKGANFLITPFDLNEDVSLIKELANVLEFGRIEVVDVNLHDEVITYLSQLPHAISIALMNQKDTAHMIIYTGDSFRDLTRIAKINEHLWSELFLDNKDKLISEIDSFIGKMNLLKETLKNEDKETLKEMMKISKSRREDFDL